VYYRKWGKTETQTAMKNQRKICLLPLEVLPRFAICFPAGGNGIQNKTGDYFKHLFMVFAEFYKFLFKPINIFKS